MNTATAAQFRSYVSVMPSTGRPIDLYVGGFTLDRGMTYRSLGHGPIVYVFTEHADELEARTAVAALIGPTGTVVDSGSAAAGASRVTLDPSLLATA